MLLKTVRISVLKDSKRRSKNNKSSGRKRLLELSISRLINMSNLSKRKLALKKRRRGKVTQALVMTRKQLNQPNLIHITVTRPKKLEVNQQEK
jgi:hypothetical protein